MIKNLKNFNVQGKRVLVRCDFNVPLDEKGNIEDDFRIKQTLPTIEYLIKNKAKIILMSHLDDPGGRVEESLRLTPIQKKLSKLLGFSVKKADYCIGEDIEKQTLEMKPGEVLLLENLRFHKGEEKNSPEFAKDLARLGDIYVNDAFGCSHRAHASIVGITDYLLSCAGFLMEKEIKVLSEAMENPKRPLVSIIGGAKISTKIKLIQRLLEKSDNLLIGGGVVNTILLVRGDLPMDSLTPEVVIEVNRIDLSSPKIKVPIDGIVSIDKSGGEDVREAVLSEVKKEERIFDIGPKTIKEFSDIIKTAKTIIFAGPPGIFENPKFEKGTKELIESIVHNKTAYKIVGGGDTLFAVSKFNSLKKFDHVSTGGGALLAFLGGEELPGLKALDRR
jgi:phosphoglycerate kinase